MSASLRRFGVYLLIAVPALGLCAIAFAAGWQDPGTQQSNDPVADAARKARAQKKSEPKPKKVYTNDDVPSGGASSSASPASSTGADTAEKKDAATAEANAEGSAAGQGAAAKNDEATWRKRFAETRVSGKRKRRRFSITTTPTRR
jgi:hypothetical protein